MTFGKKTRETNTGKRGAANKARVSARLTAAVILPLFFFAVPALTELIFTPHARYLAAAALTRKGEYAAAEKELAALGEFGDSAEIIAECRLRLGLAALEKGDADAALEYFALIGTAYPGKTEKMRGAFYSYALRKKDAGDRGAALALFGGVLKGYGDSDYLLSSIYYERGLGEFQRGNYPEAYRFLENSDANHIPETADLKERCRQIFYDALVSEFDAENREDGALTSRISVPEGFWEPMLDGYADAEKYRLYSDLLGAWSARERAENTALIYGELGDFLDAENSGFAAQRLYRRRYADGAGYHFTIDEDGYAVTNLPRYVLGGYYGLYGKIENGVYYIGSDEVRWTKQFSFTFGGGDKTLWVYSYASGREYELTLDESPVYA